MLTIPRAGGALALSLLFGCADADPTAAHGDRVLGPVPCLADLDCAPDEVCDGALAACATSESLPAPPDAPSPAGEEPTSNVDIDGDGLSDAQEIVLGTDPTMADSDGDGLGDPQELWIATDPLSPDTDADGVWDGDENTAGSDPLDGLSTPGSIACEEVANPGGS